MKLLAPLIIGFAVVSACSASGQKNFPDIPEHHWVFEDLSQLARSGLYDQASYQRRFPQTRLSSRPTSRAQLAGAVIFFCNSAVDLADKEDTILRQIGRLPNDRAAADALNSARQKQSRFRTAESVNMPLAALLKEFAPEIQNLGEKPVDLRRSTTNATYRLTHLQVPMPGSALVQFKDVPANHWAAEAVLALRKLGILQGYSDGEFRGGSSYP